MLPDVSPQLPTLVDLPPSGDNWLHEVKFDGYRMMIRVENGARLYTRNGHDWTSRFPAIAKVCSPLPTSIIDAELVSVGKDGVSNFKALQEAISQRRTSGLVLMAFDLLYLDGDLRRAPLAERKAKLKELIGDNERIRYSDHMEGRGIDLFQHACELSLEGIVSKRVDSRYTSGRSREWLKVKCTNHDEFVVGGYTTLAGGAIGSLLLGEFEGDKLVYVGRVKTGFSESQRKQLQTAFRKLASKAMPFTENPKKDNQHWLKPEMVVEVEYLERTGGGLRHASFRGIREDRGAREIQK